VAVALTAAPAPAQAAPERLFAADSVWNKRLGADARLDPRSPRYVRALDRQIRSAISRRRLYPNIQANRFSTPIYRVGPGAPRVPVALDTGSWGNGLRSALAAGVPIPAGATPAEGSDAHLTVYQPSTDTLWEFWRARRKGGMWRAGWGGAIHNVSRSAGYYSSAAWPGLSGRDGWNWGSTASSLPVAAGTVTRAELRRGRIPHALAAALPNPCRRVFSWPAQRTDGTSDDPDCLPEGARLRLDPRVDLDRLRLPRVTRMLAEAAQRHGIVVRDRTGDSLAFYLESPVRASSSPYTGARGLYRGTPSWRMLERFPWHRLQVLPLHRCTRSPCPAPPAG
jgi:hypothetical protein